MVQTAWGSNSLLDLVVFGRAAAHRAAETVDKKAGHKKLKEETLPKLMARLDAARGAKGKISVSELRLKNAKSYAKSCGCI